MSTATSRTSPGEVPPTLYGHRLWGNLRHLQRDPLQFYASARAEFGDVVRLRAIPFFSWYLISHPNDIERVLQSNQRNYRKPYRYVNAVQSLTGQGIGVSEGELWRRQRQLVQPAFHRQRLAAFAPLMTTAAEATAERWSRYAERGGSVDIETEMPRLTLQIAGLALFSTDISQQADQVGRAIRLAFEQIYHRLTHPLTLPQRMPTRRNRRFLVARQTLDGMIFGFIRERRRTGEDAGDLLSMLLGARDEETGEGMSDQQVRDEVFSLLLTSYMPTAVALVWTWYLLSQHRTVEHKLQAELAQVLGGRPPTVEDLRQLSYTSMIIEECLRLYPPAWGQPRQAIAEDCLGGYHIPAGARLFLCQWVTHRHPDFWEEPERFDPERFTPERSVRRPHFAYFPFGGGARQCLGYHFVMMELRLVLATLAQRFRLELVPYHPVEPEPLFIIHPRYGLPMTVHGRSSGP